MLATPEGEPEAPIDYFCPVCRESWGTPEEGHEWEFDVVADELQCPTHRAKIIRVQNYTL